MGKHENLIFQILHGMSDANIGFDELCSLLSHLGFEMRVRGSHHVFRKQGVQEKVNLQRQGSQAKPYQVKQIRAIIQKHKLAKEE